MSAAVHMIWAEARGGVIGAAGGIPWRIPGEQAMFREKTMGATVVMGRATWDSLPEKVRPLPGRRNVVLTRDRAWSAEGAEVRHAVEDVGLGLAPTSLPQEGPAENETWIIGGAAIYCAFLPYATHIVRTRIDAAIEGDTYAPALGDEWTVTDKSDWRTAPNGLRYVVEELTRSGA